MLPQPEQSAGDSGQSPQGWLREADAVAPLAEATERVEARCAARRPASQVTSITGIRLSPHGANAALVNISASGVLVVSTYRFRLGATVTVVFDGTFSPTSVQGRVARSSVAAVSKDGVLRYHIGIAFDDPCALKDALAPADPPPAQAPQPEAAMPPPSPTELVNRW